VAVLPGILVLESPRLACATAKEVVADQKHPDSRLTVNKGSLIKVTLPRSTWPFGTFGEVSSSNSRVLARDQTPCGWQPSENAMSFEFKAVSEGSAQLQTVGPTGGIFGFAWTAQVWEVTVNPDYGVPLLVGIDLVATGLAAGFIYWRRQGRVIRPATGRAG
jgi:hypothetical protein